MTIGTKKQARHPAEAFEQMHAVFSVANRE
jgi:hypothetical protein